MIKSTCKRRRNPIGATFATMRRFKNWAAFWWNTTERVLLVESQQYKMIWKSKYVYCLTVLLLLCVIYITVRCYSQSVVKMASKRLLLGQLVWYEVCLCFLVIIIMFWQFQEPSVSDVEHDVSCCCCVSGNVNVKVTINKQCFVPGESIVINAEIDNQSSSTIERIWVKLQQVVLLLWTSKRCCWCCFIAN